MDATTIVIIIVELLIGLVTLLSGGISILIFYLIKAEKADRKSSVDKLWKKVNDETKIIVKNEKNIVKIATSIDVDIED